MQMNKIRKSFIQKINKTSNIMEKIMGNFYLFMENFSLSKPSKLKQLAHFCAIPIFFGIEFILFLYYWRKIIIPELLQKNEIVDFLEKNDFKYYSNYIAKFDLLSSNEYFDRLDLEEAKYLIRKEYCDAFLSLIKKYCSLNVENLINLYVDVDVKTTNFNGIILKEKIYIVYIRYSRFYFVEQYWTKFAKYLIFVSILVSSMLLIYINVS